MKIKEAPWEQRNLNVVGCEFYVDRNESWDSIRESILCHPAEYKVLHIESGNTDALTGAQRDGFAFVEMNIQLRAELSVLTVPKIFDRFIPHISYTFADEKQVEEVLSIVETGTMFTTDKVSVDPYFGSQMAGRRYSLWSMDVIQSGAKMMLAKYKGMTVGFDILVNHGEDIVEAFLGGVLPEFANKGFGFAPLYLAIEASQKLGYKKMITGVSSNNLPILKIHEMFGFKTVDTSYALIKHEQRNQ